MYFALKPSKPLPVFVPGTVGTGTISLHKRLHSLLFYLGFQSPRQDRPFVCDGPCCGPRMLPRMLTRHSTPEREQASAPALTTETITTTSQVQSMIDTLSLVHSCDIPQSPISCSSTSTSSGFASASSL